MTIRHVDRAGNPWAFNLDCTPTQGRMFERLLTFVRTIGNREELTLSYLQDLDGNTAFRDGMEHAVLSALRDWAEPPTGTPDTSTANDKVSETVNVNPSTVSGTINTNDTEPDEEREPYYWERF